MLHPRVVDHDVDLEVKVRDGVQVGQIGYHGEASDLVGDGFSGDVTVEDRNAGTGLGERGGDRLADPGCTTGHQSASPSQRSRILLLGWGHASTLAAAREPRHGAHPHSWVVNSGAQGLKRAAWGGR